MNLTKKQYLHPHKLGDGLKLMEFGASGNGTMLGLAALLANSNGRGGGDLHSTHPIVGSWAGDRIVIAGDYAERGDRGEKARLATGAKASDRFENLYHLASDDNPAHGWEDISYQVVEALADDAWAAQRLCENYGLGGAGTESYFASKLPPELRAKLLGQLTPAIEATPLHVRLAEAVLRAPDEPGIWRGLVDCLLETVIDRKEK